MGAPGHRLNGLGGQRRQPARTQRRHRLRRAPLAGSGNGVHRLVSTAAHRAPRRNYAIQVPAAAAQQAAARITTKLPVKAKSRDTRGSLKHNTATVRAGATAPNRAAPATQHPPKSPPWHRPLLCGRGPSPARARTPPAPAGCHASPLASSAANPATA